MLLKSYFKPVPNAWASFVVHTLEGTSCSSEIPLRQVHTIAAVFDGVPINGSELIANNIYDFVSKNWMAVAHSSLICWLCEEADVNLYSNDLHANTMKPVTDKIVEGFVKDYHEDLRKIQVEEEGGAQPQPEPHPQQAPS